jgi:hypothetical protein
MGNITPLFYVETLADLDKEVKAGKTPEQVVGMLASKTPFHAVPNVYHRTILLSELAGNPVEMDGRPILGGGTPKRTSEGTTSIHFDEFPEAAALNRWQSSEFSDIERAVAKDWRRQLTSQDHEAKTAQLRNIFPTGLKISTLEDLKSRIDEFATGDYRQLIELAMDVLDVPSVGRPKVIARWEAAGSPPLLDFAPYATHVFKIDALLYLGIDRGFISGDRPSNVADIAYLYYLPFAMVFTSGDKLHARTVPLFLRSDQSYLPADEMKAALRELDSYFDGFPDEVKSLGVMQFSGYPPHHIDNVVTRLWDKHMRPDWRDIAKEGEEEHSKPRDKKLDAEFVKQIKEEQAKGVPLEGSEAIISTDDVDQVFITRRMPVHRGKWRMVSREVEESSSDG